MDRSLKDAIDYDPATGFLVWKKRPDSHFRTASAARAWNARNAGKPALSSLSSEGYLRGNLNRKQVYAHRAAWFLATGEKPETVDHINGDRADNRLCNLRAASVGQNNCNRSSDKGSSRYVGVAETKHGWVAYVHKGRRQIYLGTFACETAAAIRRDVQARGLHGEFATLNLKASA